MVHPYPAYCASFSYTGRHCYLLTFVTFMRMAALTQPDVVHLAWSQILRAAHEKHFEVLAYTFMPDHVHLVVEGMTDSSDLKAFAKLAKQYSGYYYARGHGGGKLWQRYGSDRIIREQPELLDRIRYVVNNPVAAGLVARPHDYPFLGSQRWSREELLERFWRADPSAEGESSAKGDLLLREDLPPKGGSHERL